MIQYENLVLIGTSHIAIESVNEVKRVIKDLEPGFVALELDRGRFMGLMSKERKRLSLGDIRKFGVKGFLFNLFGAWVEDKLGRVVKVKPGSEMKAAVFSAAKIKSKVVLIDQDISITIRNLVQGVTFKEKWRFFTDIIKGFLYKKKMVAEFGNIDLRKVPSEKVIIKVVKRVEERYPSVFKALIDDRNKVMAKKLVNLMTKFPDTKIVAVVGAGHVEGMLALIKKSI
ncbi:hypothetical protein HOC80_04285 [archaeon]|jgi:pheromone shutdown-related protein TraB|nr:hypothetical protein [archaeon]MBT4417292.1 hypothetical protein [archaeon]